MRVSKFLGAVMVWLLSVGTVAAIAWFAIDSAGRQVVAAPGYLQTVVDLPKLTPTGSPAAPAQATTTATPQTTLGQAVTSSSPGQSTPATSAPAPTASVQTGSPTGTGPSSTPSGRGSGQPTSTPRGTGHRPPAGPGSGQPSNPPTSPPSPRPIGDSVATVGGSVDAVCVGWQLTDAWRAQPNNGWGASASRPSLAELDVRFIRIGREVDVVVTCPGGRPKFVVDVHGGDE